MHMYNIRIRDWSVQVQISSISLSRRLKMMTFKNNKQKKAKEMLIRTLLDLKRRNKGNMNEISDMV